MLKLNGQNFIVKQKYTQMMIYDIMNNTHISLDYLFLEQ